MLKRFNVIEGKRIQPNLFLPLTTQEKPPFQTQRDRLTKYVSLMSGSPVRHLVRTSRIKNKTGSSAHFVNGRSADSRTIKYLKC